MKKEMLLLMIAVMSVSFVVAQNPADIVKAYNIQIMRPPNAMESIPANYNNGHWNSYKELSDYVAQYLSNLASAGITIKVAQNSFSNNTKLVGVYQNGKLIAADLVAAGGGNLVAAGGGNLVAAGGGNLVAAGGGNLVAAGGGNLIAADGTKMMVTTQTPGLTFGSEYTIKSAGTTIIKTSGTGAFIIR